MRRSSSPYRTENRLLVLMGLAIVVQTGLVFFDLLT